MDPPAPSPPADAALHIARVLIVDDDLDLVGSVEGLLRRRGYMVFSAHTGEEGLQVLRATKHPDVILLDVDMPVLGGPEMAHQMMLHEAGEERIPIILFSANADLAAVAARMGTPYWLSKPCDTDAMVGLIARAIRERRAPTSA